MQILPAQLQDALTRGYNDIALFSEVLLGLPMHEGQKTFLRNAHAKVNNLVPANRWGKSITIAVKHIHHNFYKVGVGRGNTEAHNRTQYRTANLAPHSDATKPVFDAIKAIMTSSFPIPQEDGSMINNKCQIGWFLREEGIRNSTPYLIPFINNTEILFRSTGEDKGDSIQGKNFGYISYDEGGRSNHLKYELDANIIPRLADLNGSLDIVSTPDMRSASILDHYELFEKGINHEPGYYSQEGSIAENIFLLRNNPTYIEDETARLKGNPLLDQVLYGKFVFAGDALYPTKDIMASKDESLDGGVRYEEGHNYTIGIDTAMGEDEMVYTVLDTTDYPYRVVRQMAVKGNSKSPEAHMNDFLDLIESYMVSKPGTTEKLTDNIRIILETWNGESMRFYKDMPQNIQQATYCWGSGQPEGIPPSVASAHRRIKKAEIVLAPRKLMSKDQLRIPNEPSLVKQLSIYREDDTKLPTDRVISLALACWLATDGKPTQENVELIQVDW